MTREGEIGAGDAIELLARDPGGLTVADVIGLYADDADKQLLLERASLPPALPAGWRDYFRKRLWAPDG